MRTLIADDGVSAVYEVTDSKGRRIGYDVTPSPGSPDDNQGRIADQLSAAVDALEPLLTKQAWSQADAAARWAVVRRVMVVALKAARLAVGRLESTGGDPT